MLNLRYAFSAGNLYNRMIVMLGDYQASDLKVSITT
jgi:hypothetical protein